MLSGVAIKVKHIMTKLLMNKELELTQKQAVVT